MKVGNIVFILGLLSLTACSSLGPVKSDEDQVKERTQLWLNALLEKNPEKAWSYTTPAYQASTGYKQYFRRVAGSVNWTGGRVVDAECEQERCQVKYEIDYSLPRFSLENTRLMENTWIKLNGKWWLYEK